MPTASPPSSTAAEPPLDGALTPTVAKDRFTGVEEALAKLAHKAANDAPDLRTPAPRPDSAAVPRMPPPLAATLRPADLRDPFPSEKPRKRIAGTAARLLIAACIGAAAILAWRSYGGAAKDMVAAFAPRLSAVSTRALPSEMAESPASPAPQLAAAPTVPSSAVAEPTLPAAAPDASPTVPPAAADAQPAAVAPSDVTAAPADHQQIETASADHQ